ncbi:sporulation-specific diadenylate cyclase CdaS [Metabacillus herbersteinensis]|uniref:Diadenylate cyclase n=1 Tax=Metabacillus herbersteinensis TaxID=283816 RepID=A0ABV6GMI4_9BACI
MNETVMFEMIKKEISNNLDKIIKEASLMKKSLSSKDYCLLCELEEIKGHFQKIQSTASSFYLEAYLAMYTPNYSALAKASQNLSERRHGGLIVVERSQSVEPFIQKGVQLQAELSSTLLESIFYPGNPLHDGGVVVRGNAIFSATNVLPLSSQRFTFKVGTRHRAAIGLSEICDALILVISEETGKKSFAINGTLYPISTE